MEGGAVNYCYIFSDGARADRSHLPAPRRHNALTELYVRELTQKNVLRVFHVQTELNVANMMTKPLALSGEQVTSSPSSVG